MTTLKRKFAEDQVHPFSIEWIIKEETIRETTSSLMTNKFDIPNLSDIKYYVALQPKRCDKDPKGETYVYVNLLMTKDMNVSGVFNISCKSANFTKDLNYVYKSSGGWGTRLSTFKDLFDEAKKIIVDKQLILTVSGNLTIENVEKKEAKMPKIEKSLGHMLWESEADKNISIVIDGENELKAHKCVLKRRSTKFAKLLDIKPEPGTAETKAKIIIQNKTFDTVKEAIMHCYDIQNSDTLSAKNASNILIFADEYEIQDLKENMEEFCIKNLSVSNATLFANSSISAKSDKLKSACLQFLSNCMKTSTAVKDISEINEEMKETLFFQSFYTVVEN